MSEAELPFFDTNILIYLLSAEAAKADKAEALLGKGGVVSVQVLNEFTSVARRKLGMPLAEIREVLSAVRAICAVEPVSLETHDLALDISERFGFSIYDALIIAAARLAHCSVLYSEDLQDGQRIEELVIRNPFSS
jgi:predicted nucleic acid-binding protein